MTVAPAEILQQIHDRLAQPTAPARLIEALLPSTHADAVAWARRLPLWDEYRSHYPDQVIALARVISRRAMREFNLSISADGRVRERAREGASWKTPAPALTFPLAVGGEDVRVEYTPEYFPGAGQDHFSFVSPHTPPQAHPLSETGYLSQFVPHDAVEACLRRAVRRGPASRRRQAAGGAVRGPAAGGETAAPEEDIAARAATCKRTRATGCDRRTHRRRGQGATAIRGARATAASPGDVVLNRATV